MVGPLAADATEAGMPSTPATNRVEITAAHQRLGELALSRALRPRWPISSPSLGSSPLASYAENAPPRAPPVVRLSPHAIDGPSGRARRKSQSGTSVAHPTRELCSLLAPSRCDRRVVWIRLDNEFARCWTVVTVTRSNSCINSWQGNFEHLRAHKRAVRA